MTTATRVLAAHVPSALADRVDVIAAQSARSRGWIVKQALAAWVDQEEERHRMTLEALAEVTSGQVIDHASVRAWADSLSTDGPLPPPSARRSAGPRGRPPISFACTISSSPSRRRRRRG